MSLAQVAAALADHGVVALRQAADKAVRIGSLGGSDHGSVVGALVAVAEVFHDRAVKQPAFL